MRIFRLILVLLCPIMLGKVYAQSTERISAPLAEPSEFVDIRQADARIRHIFATQSVDDYGEAVHLYLSLLARLKDDVSPEEAAILLAHLQTTVMVLPGTLQAEMGLDEERDPGVLAGLPDETGRRLVQWWRRQDTLPATKTHERLEEHLTRVFAAREAYGVDADPRGFDDRGEIYVRFGEPEQRVAIQVNPAMLAFDFRNVRPTDPIPENEVWTYRRVHDAAYYVFVRHSRQQPYRLGSSSDLIPPTLRNGITSSSSGLRKARLLLGILEEVYGQLALLHPDFGVIYDEITIRNGLPYSGASRPDLFVQQTLLQAQAEDDAAAWRRAHEVPASYSTTYSPAEDLPVSIRWARFLDPDGTTRTEVYWNIAARDLSPSRRLVQYLEERGQTPSEQYLLSVSIAQQTADYGNVSIQHKHYLAPATSDGVWGAQTFVVRGDTSLYHLAVQWEQRWTQAGGPKTETLEPGARLKIGTAHIDSLEALHGEGERLEMSDLKPLVRLPSDEPQEAMPYPYSYRPPASRLTLYFELYHLLYGADDQTHYTIAYEVRPRAERRTEGTTVQTHYTGGTSRVTKEYIDLDLSPWKGQDPLDITVRVTDEVSGQQVARTISFAPQP